MQMPSLLVKKNDESLVVIFRPIAGILKNCRKHPISTERNDQLKAGNLRNLIERSGCDKGQYSISSLRHQRGNGLTIG